MPILFDSFNCYFYIKHMPLWRKNMRDLDTFIERKLKFILNLVISRGQDQKKSRSVGFNCINSHPHFDNDFSIFISLPEYPVFIVSGISIE